METLLIFDSELTEIRRILRRVVEVKMSAYSKKHLASLLLESSKDQDKDSDPVETPLFDSSDQASSR